MKRGDALRITPVSNSLQLARLETGATLCAPFLKNMNRPSPVHRDSRPISPRRGKLLAVCGRLLTCADGLSGAVGLTATGGGSTTCVSATVAPVGAMASTGAVFSASMG